MQKVPMHQTDPLTNESRLIGYASMHHIVEEISYDGIDHVELRVLGKDGKWICLFHTTLEDLYLMGTTRFPAVLKLDLWGQTRFEDRLFNSKPQSGEPEQDLASVS